MKTHTSVHILQETFERFASVSNTWTERTPQRFHISRDAEPGEMTQDEMSVMFTAQKRIIREQLVTEFVLKKYVKLTLTFDELPWGVRKEFEVSRAASAANVDEISIRTLDDQDEEMSDDDEVVCHTTREYILDQNATLKAYDVHDAYGDDEGNVDVERGATYTTEQTRGILFAHDGAATLADAQPTTRDDLEVDLAFIPFLDGYQAEIDLAGIPKKLHYRRIMAMLRFLETGKIEHQLLDYFGE